MTAPRVITEGVTNITNKKATLVGTVRSMGDIPTVAWFHQEWGPFFYRRITESVTITEDWQAYSVDVDVSVITYINRFRAVAGNADGTHEGEYIKYWVPHPAKESEGSPFYISQREVTWEDRLMTLYLWSDVPAKLRIKVSVEAPWKKRGFHFKRGKVFHHSPRVYWGWNWIYQQEEIGDVLLHTFKVPFPTANNTLWMQATGSVDGTWSPSRSPFFRYSYTPSVLDLGIYSKPDVLQDKVYLEEGTDIVLSYDRPSNTIKITKSGSHHGRRRRPGRPPGPPRPP